MKILAIHNFHRAGSASGDDQVFKNETALLESNGHKVIRYTVSNNDFDHAKTIGKIIAALGMLWSFRHYKAVKKLIEKERPDIVHVHTFFPLLSPSILYAAKRKGCPVIATLHDTRFICPCATSLRGVSLCNQCGDGHYFRMWKHRCFKGSRLQSFIVAAIFKYHRIRKTFYLQIDRYICLNDSQIQLLTNIGFDPEKITKKYNFVPDITITFEKRKHLPERYVVFYGRLGEEKGIHILMKIWDDLPDIPLVIMGDGPLRTEVEKWATKKKNIVYLGYVNHTKCIDIVHQAEFVVFPSIWYEGCSMVEIESLALSCGLIATDLGFSSETIKNGYNGYKISIGNINGFKETIKDLWSNPDKCKEMGIHARKEYESKYTPEDNLKQLTAIYENQILLKKHQKGNRKGYL